MEDGTTKEYGNEAGDARLSRIETLWSVVRRANSPDDEARAAQRMLLDRYGSAIQRYLIAAVKNVDLADEMFQEFAIKLINGDLGAANPARGKFRSYVKTILFRMVALHYRKLSSSKERNFEQMPDAAPQKDGEDLEEENFLLAWREGVLAKAWNELESAELNGGPAHFSVLRARVENPAANSDELAKLISDATGKEVKSGNARVQVHRSREKFAHALFQTIADSLEEPTRQAVEEELVELRLIDYCRDAFEGFQFSS